MYRYNTLAASNLRFSDSALLHIIATGTLAVANGVIYVNGTDFTLNMMSNYSVYNVTIICIYDREFEFPSDRACSMTCNETNSNQFVIIDDSCNCTIDSNCNVENNTNYINNDTIAQINEIFSVINEFEQLYDIECGKNNISNSNSSNNSLTFDIGYPVFGETFINSDDGASICCRGSESCAYSRTIFSNLGNIFCTGEFACGNSKSIWTGDYVEALGPTRSVTIFCMASASCYGSVLESADRIICGVYSACENAEIDGALTLYCMYDACSRTILTQVEMAYIYDLQTEMTIYSGSVGTMKVNFIGKDAGTDVEFTCSDGDKCFINCAENSCSKNTTILFCYGKCFVTCNGIQDNKDCVNIAHYESPTTSPSDAPTNAPTGAPTLSDALTHRDVSTWFNWVLWSILALIAFMVIVGYGDAKQIRTNELFAWTSILSFGFYSIDFFSDLFFSMKLYLFMIDDNHDIDEYQLIYTVLFSCSIIFIFIPLIFNLFQLQRELSKWLNDPILLHTEAPVWILSFMRLLYFVSIISGSSFSAVALFNSNLFQLKIFGMGLSRYHKTMFANKRFFSVVLLEVCNTL